jgi:hypothetical protein
MGMALLQQEVMRPFLTEGNTFAASSIAECYERECAAKCTKARPRSFCVYCSVAVRMVFLQDFADYTRRFGIFPSGKKPLPEHCVEDPPLDRF